MLNAVSEISCVHFTFKLYKMKLCVICDNEGKYKCPTCLIYYCSVSCCKQHRSQNCEVASKPPESSSEAQQTTVKFPTKSTVAAEKLELLRESEELKEILKNPHLRGLLEKIDKSDKPEESMQKAMLEPLFVEFADACLKVVEPRQSDDET